MPEARKVILMLPSITMHSRGLLRGIGRYSRLHGPWTFLHGSWVFYRSTPFYRKPDNFSYLKKWGADGVITPDIEENKEIIAMGLPVIICIVKEKRNGKLPSIISDNDSVARMAAEHLLNRGFRQFAYYSIVIMPCYRQRQKRFCEHIAKAGFKTHVYKDRESSEDMLVRCERNHLIKWLRSLPKPVGLMAGNDFHGRHIIETCRVAGINVPEEIAVIGVDNDSLICDLTTPPLSSIVLNSERAGFQAAELLDKLMSGEAKMTGQKIIVHPTHTMARRSTNILAIEDKEVADAVRFIRRNAQTPIQIDDVISVIPVSRRNMEKRFRKVLGRSIHQEITRVRVGRIIRMLSETGLSVSHIAAKLGLHDDKHIGRYFQHHTGISITEYRKKYITKSV